MRPHTLVLAALLALGAMLPRTAVATSQVLLSDTEHIQEAQIVVRGTVSDQVVKLHPTLKRPMTHTTILVSEVLYGVAPMTLTVVQMGGEYGGETLYISGDARMEKGEEVVLFLTERNGVWMFTAMEQSKYTVMPSLNGDVLHRELTSGFFLRGPEGTLKQLDTLHDPDIRLEDMKKLLIELEGGE